MRAVAHVPAPFPLIGAALLIVGAVFSGAAAAVARGDGPALAEVPFGPGEVFRYVLKWRFITGGRATLRVVRDSTDGDLWQIQARARSTGFVDFFYTVRDTINSTIDRRTLLPTRFEKRQHEGWYHRDSAYVFDQKNRTILRQSGAFACSVYVHDILSSLYRIRARQLVVGRDLRINIYADGKLYAATVRVLRRETVTVPAGTFSCVVIEPILQSEAIFVQKGRLWIWLTNDERHMPVLMQSAIPVGKIRAELVSYRSPAD